MAVVKVNCWKGLFLKSFVCGEADNYLIENRLKVYFFRNQFFKKIFCSHNIFYRSSKEKSPSIDWQLISSNEKTFFVFSFQPNQNISKIKGNIWFQNNLQKHFLIYTVICIKTHINPHIKAPWFQNGIAHFSPFIVNVMTCTLWIQCIYNNKLQKPKLNRIAFNNLATTCN